MVAEHEGVRVDGYACKVGLGDGWAVDALDDGLTHLLVRQHGRLGVEGEVTPLQRPGLTHLGVGTLLRRLVAVLRDDARRGVDLPVGESLGLSGVVHRLEGDGVKLRLLAPPLVITLDGQGLRGLVSLRRNERSGEPIRVQLFPSLVEGSGVRRPFLGQNAAQGRRPVGIGTLEGNDDVGVLVALLHRGDLVETIGAGRQEARLRTVVGLPSGLVIRVIDGTTGIPLGLRVEVQGHDLFAALGLHIGRGDVVRVRLWSAVLSNVKVLDADKVPDRR